MADGDAIPAVAVEELLGAALAAGTEGCGSQSAGVTWVSVADQHLPAPFSSATPGGTSCYRSPGVGPG